MAHALANVLVAGEDVKQVVLLNHFVKDILQRRLLLVVGLFPGRVVLLLVSVVLVVLRVLVPFLARVLVLAAVLVEVRPPSFIARSSLLRLAVTTSSE